MTEERRKQVKRVFEVILQVNPEQRDLLLASVEGGIRAELRSLLADHSRESFKDQTPANALSLDPQSISRPTLHQPLNRAEAEGQWPLRRHPQLFLESSVPWSAASG